MVIEQTPRLDNRIALSENQQDQYGQPLAVIEWSVGQIDTENLTNAADAFQKAWEKSYLAALARFVRRPTGEAEAELSLGGGIYHPGGSTRMGKYSEQGVVDKDLRLFRVPNVSVVATSVFPSGGGTNPTMTLIMFALRSVDGIAKKLGNK